jgi:HD-GYP domain-containing protein (c-di-GMP phosphodiesterase class II)
MKSLKADNKHIGNQNVIPVAELYPGMIFDSPVFVEGDNLLVDSWTPIKKSDIERLNHWRIEYVETAGAVTKTTRRIAGYGGEFKPGDNDESYVAYIFAIKRLETVFKDIEDGNEVIQERISSIVGDLLKCIRENRSRMLQYVLFGEPSARQLAVNAVHCTIISVTIGEKLELLNHQLFKLGIAALLHDVGMIQIPETITNKKEKLSQEEYNKIKRHVFHSYDIIVNDIRFEKEIGEYALFHHENFDGGGYPKHLSGEKIPLSSRIIVCADAYTAMVNERAYGERMSGYNSLKTIISDNCKRFDPNVTQALLSSIGYYPIGSIVVLNNQDIGRVVDMSPQTILRPKVKIIKKHNTRENDKEEIIDLLKTSDLYIMSAVEL